LPHVGASLCVSTNKKDDMQTTFATARPGKIAGRRTERPHAFRAGALFGMLFVSSALLCSAHAASPDDSPQVWLNPGVFSRHFERNPSFREDNVGLGAELLPSPDHGVMAGTFINSQRARTRYGAYQWRPLHWLLGDTLVSAGIAVGGFDGYPRYRDGAWFAAALPILAIEGKRLGANVSIVPTLKDRVDGAVVLQVKLRVW
jgi:hypothetical protein